MQKRPSLFWRLILNLAGLGLCLYLLGGVLLLTLGEKATAKVQTRRVGGSDPNQAPNQRYEWAISYDFRDKDGEAHSGHATRRGGDMGIRVDNRVRYLPFCPWVSGLEDHLKPSFGHLFIAGIAGLILYVANRNPGRGGRSRNTKAGKTEEAA